MKTILGLFCAVASFAGVVAACTSSDTEHNTNTLNDGGGTLTFDDGSTIIDLGEGGLSNSKIAKVQLMNILGPNDTPTAQDIYVKNYSNNAYVLAKGNLAYGETASLDVPVSALSDVTMWSVAVGTQTADITATRSIQTDSYSESRPGPFTILLMDAQFAGSEFQYKKFYDKEEAYAPSSGKAAVMYIHAGLDGIADLPLGYEFGIQGGTCFDSNAALNEQRLDVDPGARTFAVYDSSSATGCTGPVLAQTESLTLAAGESFLLVPVGETKATLSLKALKLNR